MGEVPRIDLLHALQRADFLLNTSHSEGSSNAICEAIALRTPVIASAIPGNIGVLGSEYPGLFRPDDAESLAAILDKFSDSGEFRNELKQHCDRLKTVFSVEQEKKAWSALIKQISSEKLSSYPVGSLR
jgi:glycosyltransferase involved in cell wall biosynthesis